MNIITDRIPPETHNKWIGIDTELSNMKQKHLHRPNGDFELMSVAIDEDVYMINSTEKIIPTLANIKDNWWVFMNAKFDITQLRRWADIPPRNRLWDVMLIEKILFGGYYDTFNLGDITRRHLHFHMEKDLQKSFLGEEITKEQLTYSAMDAYVLPKIAEKQKQLTTKDDFNIWMNIDLPAMWAFMDFIGFAIDVDKWKDLALKNKTKEQQIKQELPFNPSSNGIKGQAVTFYRKHGFTNIKSNTEKEITKFINQYPNTKAAEYALKVLEYKKAGTYSSKYGDKFLDYVEDDNGVPVIVCNYWITNAETGRTAATDPPMQGVPKRETLEFRECFIARPDHSLIIADYSAQEVFVAAHQSQDKALIEVCNSDEDVYVASARLILGKEITKKDPLRDEMKPLVLGANYGMSKYGVAKKLGCSLEEAEEIIEKRIRAFPRLQEYLNAQIKSKNKVKTPAGRTIHLNHYTSQAERNALNGPVQGGAADCAKKSLANLHRNWFANFPIRFSCVEFTHDELGLDVPNEYAQDIAKYTEKTLIDTANEMFPGMKFRADAHITDNWAGK